jgi:hypothetical protein
MQQLGEIASQLSSLRFDKIGLLFEGKEGFSVRTCLSPGLLLKDRHTLDGISRGPFLSGDDYYRSLLSAFRQHTEALPLEHHAFLAPVPAPEEDECYDAYLSATERWNDFVALGSKIDNSKNRLDYFIAGEFLEAMVPSLGKGTVMDNREGGFPLHHPDLSASNIFVDDDCNVTCIIDWAFSSFVPMPVLLMTPGLPHSRGDTGPELTSCFRAGVTKHLTPCPVIWETARKTWLFIRLTNLDALQDYRLFTELYGLTHNQQTTDIPAIFNMKRDEPTISDMAKILAADDQSPSDVERSEKAYFSNVGLEREGLSRMLTLASSLNRGFVADRKLWRWINDAVPLK